MEINNNEIDLASPSKDFNDRENLSKEWMPACDDELTLVIGKVLIL